MKISEGVEGTPVAEGRGVVYPRAPQDLYEGVKTDGVEASFPRRLADWNQKRQRTLRRSLRRRAWEGARKRPRRRAR